MEKNWSIYSSPHPPHKKIYLQYIGMKNIYYCNWSIHNKNAALTYQALDSFHVE